MTTHTANHGFHFKTLRAGLWVMHRPTTQDLRCAETAARADWIERLAAWAERQPNHHRLGSWMLMR
jgi:hypothetical protein